MEKVGILYICTGKYKLFWDGFYKSAEENFLTEMEKHYFVFSESCEGIQEEKNVHFHKIDCLPWPLTTLLRYNYFLSIIDELKKMDYLVFSNANMKVVESVSKEDFLPREEENENLCVVLHPGLYKKHKSKYQLERNPKSTAFIPYGAEKHYVIGAMNGGTTEGFLNMCEELNEAINIDLSRNFIARWHDESHLNKYVLNHGNIRILPPSYAYPSRGTTDYKRIITGIPKESVFDVEVFKGLKKERRLVDKINDRVSKVTDCFKYYLGLFFCLIYRK